MSAENKVAEYVSMQSINLQVQFLAKLKWGLDRLIIMAFSSVCVIKRIIRKNMDAWFSR